jgi:hypothetical protein
MADLSKRSCLAFCCLLLLLLLLPCFLLLCCRQVLQLSNLQSSVVARVAPVPSRPSTPWPLVLMVRGMATMVVHHSTDQTACNQGL